MASRRLGDRTFLLSCTSSLRSDERASASFRIFASRMISSWKCLVAPQRPRNRKDHWLSTERRVWLAKMQKQNVKTVAFIAHPLYKLFSRANPQIKENTAAFRHATIEAPWHRGRSVVLEVDASRVCKSDITFVTASRRRLRDSALVADLGVVQRVLNAWFPSLRRNSAMHRTAPQFRHLRMRKNTCRKLLRYYRPFPRRFGRTESVRCVTEYMY